MSKRWRVVKNARTGTTVLARAKWCTSFWCRLRGLQLVPGLPDNTGILFVNKRESRSQTTIHMFFMLFSIGVVWLDANGQVVDKQLAKPWRPAYAPRQAARYFIEANPSILDRVQIGDVLTFNEEVQENG